MRHGSSLGIFVLALAVSGCGGESDSDAGGGTGGTPSGGTSSGGTSSGGTAGSASGGTAGVGSAGTAGSASGGTAGSASGGSGGIVDAGLDAFQCASGEVPTVEGCLTCSAASQKLSDAIEKARKANASCGTATDCVMTGSGTACSGTCGVAVSKSGEAAFQSALAYADGAYCSGFVPVCGYSSPKCAQATLECNAGSCEAKYN